MLDILLRWNRWGNHPLPSGIKRDITTDLTPYLETKEIVVLTGPRRAGKTTVLFQLMDLLESKGVGQKAMLHINLEEPGFGSKLNLALLDQLYKIYREEIFPSGKVYLFLDEIQNVPDWERWVRSRSETEEIKIFITGSSAHLMSRELATLMTGRHLSFHVFPLSFNEFLRFKQIELPEIFSNVAPSPIAHALNQYLRWGGFPAIVLAQREEYKEILLKQYFDDILFKDVVVRHNVRDVTALRNLAVYLLTQTANLISYQRISKQFGVSVELAKTYCGYLQEAFLVDSLSFYSLKIAERNRHSKKIHTIDLGLRQVLAITGSPDRGRLMETAVYHHLQRIYQDHVFYWKGKQEIDFVIEEGNQITRLVQVAANLDQSSVLDREMGALQEASQQFKLANTLLISNEGQSPVVPLWRFLIKKLTSP